MTDNVIAELLPVFILILIGWGVLAWAARQIR